MRCRNDFVMMTSANHVSTQEAEMALVVAAAAVLTSGGAVDRTVLALTADTGTAGSSEV